MSNFLHELFSTGVPEVRYSWTSANTGPTGMPHISFATGILKLTEAPKSREYFIGPRRYVDSSVKLWGADGIHIKPSSIVPPQAPITWVDQLMIMPSGSGYVVLYGTRTNFGVSVGSFYPEVYDGTGFPGAETLRTAVLIARFWTGVDCLVLSYPE